MQGLQSAWLFFQDQILGMKWLNALIGNLLNTAGLSPDTPLGGGCAACHTLMEHTQAAADALGLSVKLEAVTDFAEIAKYGVMSTPALVVNETVVSSGKVLTQDEAAKALAPLAQGQA